jgi:hypothetical protein
MSMAAFFPHFRPLPPHNGPQKYRKTAGSGPQRSMWFFGFTRRALKLFQAAQGRITLDERWGAIETLFGLGLASLDGRRLLHHFSNLMYLYGMKDISPNRRFKCDRSTKGLQAERGFGGPDKK